MHNYMRQWPRLIIAEVIKITLPLSRIQTQQLRKKVNKSVSVACVKIIIIASTIRKNRCIDYRVFACTSCTFNNRLYIYKSPRANGHLKKKVKYQSGNSCTPSLTPHARYRESICNIIMSQCTPPTHKYTSRHKQTYKLHLSRSI